MPLPSQQPSNLTVPSVVTLQKYGLTAVAWLKVLERQGWVCAICKRLPENGRFNIDHDHVKGWKKMTAHDRAKHVRGVVCFFCNKYYLGRCITVEKAQNVVKYLQSHEVRVRGNNATART